MLSTIFSLNAIARTYIDNWSKNAPDGFNHRSKLSSLFLKFRCVADDTSCKREIRDDGRNYEIDLIRNYYDEEMYAWLLGYHTIGKPNSFYDLSFQYLKGDIAIEAHIRYINDKVSLILYSFESPDSRESFSYENGKYTGI